MDIKTFKSLARVLPKRHSVLVRGRHGIGKSHIVRQLAEEFKKELGLERVPTTLADGQDPFLIDIRLSQMTEGDVIGLLELRDGVSRFAPPEWFMSACKSPKIIFLDELNRASPEVMQAAFQIVLDFELNGHRLHDDTRVYAAVNPDKGGYIVNNFDPALLDRFVVVDLEPTCEEWLEWAADNVIVQIRDFIHHNRDFLESEKEAAPGAVIPSRRSWALLSDAIAHAGLNECYEKNALFYALALTRVGAEASIKLQDHVTRMDRLYTADDILDRWDEIKDKIDSLGVERWNILIDKLCERSKKASEKDDSNEWTDAQCENAGKFMVTLPPEHMIHFWTKLVATNNIKNFVRVYKEAYPVFFGVLNKKVLEDATATEKKCGQP